MPFSEALDKAISEHDAKRPLRPIGNEENGSPAKVYSSVAEMKKAKVSKITNDKCFDFEIHEQIGIK